MRLSSLEIAIVLTAFIYLVTSSYIFWDSLLQDIFKHGAKLAVLCCCVFVGHKYKPDQVSMYLVFFLLYFILGISFGNDVRYLINDAFIFGSMACAFILTSLNRDQFTQKFIEVMSVTIVVGALSALIFFVLNELEPARSLADRIVMKNLFEIRSQLSRSLEVLNVSVFLLPFIWFLGPKQRLIVIASVALFFVANLFLLSRVGVLLIIVASFLTIFIGFKERFIRLNYFWLAALPLAFIVCVLIGFTLFFEVLMMFVQRFADLSGGSLVRRLEADWYFSSISAFEFLYGSGFGARIEAPFGQIDRGAITMIHRGESNLLFKGGLPLLIFLYGVSFLSFLLLCFSNAKYGLPWASSIVLFLIAERGHQQYSQFFVVTFVCLAISYSSIFDWRRNVSIQKK